MLIEFKVKNFRSIRDEQLLSMVASNDKTLLGVNTISTGISAAPEVLRSAVIYGANASGKSNLISALQYMRGVVLESATLIKPGQTFNVQPFKMDPECVNLPTEFMVTFLMEGVRYQYDFAMTAQRIVSESLLVYKTFKPQLWFERVFNEKTDKDEYEFGAALKGQKSVWESATRQNSLFLSMAVQLNSEQLRPIFDWFAHHLQVYNELNQIQPQFTFEKMLLPESCNQITEFMNAADFGISAIDLNVRKGPGKVLRFDLATGKSEIHEGEEIENFDVFFKHKTEKGEVALGFQEESSGTRNLLSMAGPIFEVLNKGLTLVIDEPDTSLHPLLVREVVKLFHNPEVNKHGAQLILSTHDTSLMDAFGLLRRDQIWIMEKDTTLASCLIGILEFSPRKGEALERNYLQGRYGGIPYLAGLSGWKN